MIDRSLSQLTWLLGQSSSSFTLVLWSLINSAYLVRHEILALHQRGKPQAYPVCFQAQLAGTGTARPTDTAKFPDAYNINDEFKNYNVFDMSQDHSQFIFPGPPVYGAGAGPGSAAPPVSGGSASSAVVSLTASSASSSTPSDSGDGAYDDSAPSAVKTSSVESAVAAPAASSPVSAPSSNGQGSSEAGSESSSK
jgi:cellulase